MSEKVEGAYVKEIGDREHRSVANAEVVEFLDTRSSEVVAYIAAMNYPEIESSDEVCPRFDLPLHLGHTEHVRYLRWLRDAILLSRAGVRPAPSHKVEGEKSYTSIVGAFIDAEELSVEIRKLATMESGNEDNWGSLDENAFMFEPLRREPLVLLGLELPDDGDIVIPNLPVGPSWVAVSAQTAGIACHHRRFVGVAIKLHLEGRRRVRELAGFCDSELVGGHNCVGIGGVDEDVIGAYILTVKALGLNSLHSIHLLEEGCYPLDVEEQNLERLGNLDLHDKYVTDTLMNYPELSGSSWSLFVFGDNCD
jgi:hypothetical protein